MSNKEVSKLSYDVAKMKKIVPLMTKILKLILLKENGIKMTKYEFSQT